MGISEIKRLTFNPYFYRLLLQCFLTGYEDSSRVSSCDINLIYMVLPILTNEDLRRKLSNSNSNSSIHTLFNPKDKKNINNENIKCFLSNESKLAGFSERYELMKPYCDEALIILYSLGDISISKGKIKLENKLCYNNKSIRKTNIKEWCKASHYLGIIFSKTNINDIYFYVGGY